MLVCYNMFSLIQSFAANVIAAAGPEFNALTKPPAYRPRIPVCFNTVRIVVTIEVFLDAFILDIF